MEHGMSHDEDHVMMDEEKQAKQQEPQAAIKSRQMEDAATALEVDHMILDFLLFQAIAACLTSRESSKSSATSGPAQVDICLFQVDRFQRLFRSRYPSFQPDAELRFRQHLLQLAALTSRRLTKCNATPPKTSLRALRERNQERARQWIGDASHLPTADYNTRPFDTALPLSRRELEENRAYVLQSLDVEPEDEAYMDAFYGMSDSVALLDIVPMFMRVSASCHSMFRCTLSERWMRLAAELMLQACLEQYMVYGASGSGPMDEAFAWGPRQQEEQVEGEDTEDPFRVDIDQEEVELWHTIKAQALQTILSTERQYWKDVASHLAAVWDNHRLAKTEGNIAEFLGNLADCIPAPVLVQLQRGQLHGMSREETKTFIKSCGIDVAEILMNSSAHG